MTNRSLIVFKLYSLYVHIAYGFLYVHFYMQVIL